MRPKILITNDDSYEAKGLNVLIEAAKEIGDVLVVAPANPKSACSHSLTITKPLKLKKVDTNFYKLDDGTPSDCIYIALYEFKNFKPDIVLSGINHGANLGEDVNYSGTVAGAFEARVHNIPAIAFSQVLKSFDLEDEINWDNAKEVVKDLTNKVLNEEIILKKREILNVNIPHIKKIKGYKFVKLAYQEYKIDVHTHFDPRGEKVYWLGPSYLNFKEEENTDFFAIKNGYVSITPLKFDITSYESLNEI